MVEVKVKDNKVNVSTTGEVIIQDSSGYELYEGSYEIESRFNEQILPTEKKRLEQDVRIKAMYISEVSNEAGGTTISFG